MYKLENNVVWTDDLKNAFKHNVTRAQLLMDGLLMNETRIKEVVINDCKYVPDEGFIGQATSRMVEIKLSDLETDIALENQEIKVKLGADYNGNTYYIDYGNFIVDAAPLKDDTNGEVSITAYDYMVKFNKDYVDQMTYPCTLLALTQNVCQQAGVELATTNFANKNFIVEDNQFEGKQLRDVLKHIAKCAFSWARIGQDNRLYLDFQVPETSNETITNQEYKVNAFKKADNYYGGVNKVTYGDSDITGQEESVSDENDIQLNGLKELVINDNYFAYTTAKRRELIQQGSRLFGLRYMPIQELELIGLAYLDCTDFVKIKDMENDPFYTIPFNHVITYNGVLNDNIVVDGISDNQKKYKNKTTESAKNSRTERMVDRANQKIQDVVSQIGDRSEKTTTVTQDIDGLAIAVQDIEDLTDEVTGTTQITLQNCKEGYLLELHIYGNNTVFDGLMPSNTLTPSNTLVPRGDSRIIVTNAQGNEKEYNFGEFKVLKQNNDICDEFVLKDSKAYIVRRISELGTILQRETIEELGDYNIELGNGTNTIKIKNYNAKLYAKFIINNAFTEIFAPTIEMNSNIKQTAQEITTEVSRELAGDRIVSRINQTAEAVSIDANKININGVLSANKNFQVDLEGNMICHNGTFSGDIYTTQNGKIASATQGIMSTLFAISNGSLSGYEYLGYTIDGQNLIRSSPFVGIYIPKNFTPVQAYLIIEQTCPTISVEAGSVLGRAQNVKIGKGHTSPNFNLSGFASEYTLIMNDLYVEDITETAFGSQEMTPYGGMTVSNNIASVLEKGQLNIISAYTNNASYDNVPITWQGQEQLDAGRITGLVKLSLQIIGYLNPFEEGVNNG